MPTSSTYLVEFTPELIRDAHEVAVRRYNQSTRKYPTNHNTFIDHLAGAFGEVAFETVCARLQLPFDSAFRDPTRDGEADLFVGGVGIDIKTQRLYRPPTYPEVQMPQLESKASLVLWGVEHHNPHDFGEDTPCSPPEICSVWLFAWCEVKALMQGEAKTADRGKYRYRIPQETMPIRELTARLASAIT